MTDFARKTTLAQTGWMAFGATMVAVLIRVAGGLRAVWTMLSRFLWPIALVTLLYLIFDDFFGLLTGKDSLIGHIMDELFGAGAAAKLAKDLTTIWEELEKTFVAIKPLLRDVFNLFLDAAVEVIPYLVQGFVYLIKLIATTVSWFRAFVQSMAHVSQAFKLQKDSNGQTDWFQTVFGAGDRIWDKLTDGDISKNFGDFESKFMNTDFWKPLDFKPKAPQGPGMGGTATSRENVTDNRHLTVNIRDGRTPDETVKKIKEESKEFWGDEYGEAASLGGMWGAL